MTYYKIIVNAQIVGVATSLNCFRFQEKHQMLERTTDGKAEYIECPNALYHAWWMKPIKTNLYNYTMADISVIEEQEYNILAPLSEPLPIDEGEEVEEIQADEAVDMVEQVTVDFVRQAKINRMSLACRTTIEHGFDLELRGTVHHFSLDVQDQLNLITLSAMAQTQTLIPYHADGEECIFYTNEEINEIVETANAFKIYHTTYYNALKGYINSLETIEEINEVEYGMTIPEEYQTEVLKVLG